MSLLLYEFISQLLFSMKNTKDNDLTEAIVRIHRNLYELEGKVATPMGLGGQMKPRNRAPATDEDLRAQQNASAYSCRSHRYAFVVNEI